MQKSAKMRSDAGTRRAGTARLLLFALSFVLLQFCAFQMSAQAFTPLQGGMHANHAVTTTAKTHHGAPEQVPLEQTLADQNHGKNSPACAVSGCTLPIPVAPLLYHAQAVPDAPATGLITTIKGLPPLKTERPPIAVSL